MAICKRGFSFVMIVFGLVAVWLIHSNTNMRQSTPEAGIADEYEDHSIDDPRVCAQSIARFSRDELEWCDGPYPRFKLVSASGRNQLACWPSTGGFWVARDVHPVVLKHIGVDRFKQSWRSASSAEEDKLCKQMQYFGIHAKYYPSTDSYIAEAHEWWGEPGGHSRESYGIVESPAVVMCRLQGGEGWVFEDGDSTPELGDQMRDAISMEELCDLIRDNGGKHFSNGYAAPKSVKAYANRDTRHWGEECKA